MYVALVIATLVCVAIFMTILMYESLACDSFLVFHVDSVNQKVLPWQLLLKLSTNVMFVLLGRLLPFLTRSLHLFVGGSLSKCLIQYVYCLVPGPSLPPVFNHLQCAKTEGKAWEISC